MRGVLVWLERGGGGGLDDICRKRLPQENMAQEWLYVVTNVRSLTQVRFLCDPKMSSTAVLFLPVLFLPSCVCYVAAQAYIFFLLLDRCFLIDLRPHGGHHSSTVSASLVHDIKLIVKLTKLCQD